MRWDASFFRRSPLFWPIARPASRLEGYPDWPTPAELTLLFDGAPPVRFERAPPKPRRRRAPADARYDARIATTGVVPTRAASWHDLLNALVWVRFPRAKLALHARQYRMISARLGDDLRLPGARTAEQDAVAMLDEGGVVILCVRERQREVSEAMGRDGVADFATLVRAGAACAVVFGHAIYEGLACGGPEGVRAAAYVAAVDAVPADADARVARADESLAALLSREAPLTRADFTSVVVDPRLA
jgi:hypothetical protein